MKTKPNQLIMGIAIFILACFVLISLVKAKYMVSEKVAAKNLSIFLETNYGTTLSYNHLSRFFNSGNMNPNCFRAEIYQTDNPEIYLVLTFDAKTIASKSDVASSYPDALSFHERYLQAVVVFNTQQSISETMKSNGVLLKWDYDLISFKLDKAYTEAETLVKEQQFTDLVNTYNKELDYYHEIALIIDYPPYTNTYLKRVIAQEEDIWKLKDLCIYADGTGSEHIQDTVESEIRQYLSKTYPEQIIFNLHASYVQPSDFNKVLWIQYLEKKKTKQELKENDTWNNPTTGHLIVQYNVETQTVENIEYDNSQVGSSLDDVLEYYKSKAL